MAKRGNKGIGGTVGRVVLTAAIAGGGLFLGVRWSDRAVTLLDEAHTRHVVELIPPEQVTGEPSVRRSRKEGENPRARARSRSRRSSDED